MSAGLAGDLPATPCEDLRYVVGSGWWSTDAPDERINPGRKQLGSNFIRSTEFFALWLSSVRAVFGDVDIVVADSRAPAKPPRDLRKQVRWIELPFNARHSTDHAGQWSGWTRSVLVSGAYALAADCDVFVYVEQDCLLHGRGLLKKCREGMKTGLMFGDGADTPQPLQQSFFFVSRERLAPFLHNLAAIKARDCEIAPEWKFVFASWSPLVLACNLGLLRSRKSRKRVLRFARGRFFDILPVGSGRARPVPFDEDCFYFQHGDAAELARFVETHHG